MPCRAERYSFSPSAGPGDPDARVRPTRMRSGWFLFALAVSRQREEGRRGLVLVRRPEWWNGWGNVQEGISRMPWVNVLIPLFFPFFIYSFLICLFPFFFLSPFELLSLFPFHIFFIPCSLYFFFFFPFFPFFLFSSFLFFSYLSYFFSFLGGHVARSLLSDSKLVSSIPCSAEI